MEYYPEIYQVIPTKEHKIYLYFDDGTIRLFDASDLLANAKGRFAELLVGDVFMEACTVIGGTLAWTLDGSYSAETCLDLCPVVLYETCPTVEEPHWLFASAGE